MHQKRARTAALRVVLALGLTMSALAFSGGRSDAATPLQCQISLQLKVSYVALTGKAEFTPLFGGGSCYSDLEGTYVATVLSGFGSSTGFGPGENCPTTTTSDFRLNLQMTLLSTSTGTIRPVTMMLDAPGPNLLPGTTPVTTSAPMKTGGAGLFSYRIFHECPPAGNNAALYAGTIPN